VLTFALHGLPQSQGSKTLGTTATGKTYMRESAQGLKDWRKNVRKIITSTMLRENRKFTMVPRTGWPLLGPLAIDLVFTMKRPISAPKTRRTWPIVAPDIDKCARAILDAATLAGLWHDDSQVVDLHAWKVYPLETPRALRQPGLHATVYLIDPQGPAAGEQVALI